MPEATTTDASPGRQEDHRGSSSAAPAAPQPLKRTPLFDVHAALGAKIVPFAGFEMPVQYPTGITAEHKAVREKAGLFDVSHMGEFIVRGPQAVDFVSYVTTNDVAGLEPGQAHYSTILREDGTIVDDCLVYRADDRVLMVVNGSNIDKDFAHISRFLKKFPEAKLENISDQIALLALQGPDAARILQQHTDTDLSNIKYYEFTIGKIAGVEKVYISRTGYTGEDGFELYFPAEQAKKIWNALTASGEVTPAGLGARDSLRLEMGMALYGNDLDDTTTPLEASLGWLVKMKKGDFVGRDALAKQKEQGLKRKLVGFTTPERSFPRHGYPVFAKGKPSGEVRSGTMSPTLGIPIGTAYVPVESAAEGSPLEIEIRGKRVPAVVQKMPFYRNGSRL
ncbi:MAG TPA: glycine cleavage system aminomethyltransferase GcvT [Gemmatimonadaceae bacterium]|nr:glycine cleavage system aminomethyltransferase GcvT [Gemmatimonadaceae bacterium]